ncbi:helix-turn-helix transcriptional regulator [Leuconostoc lactis]|uniref:Helix-turn-helix transcriptional regulator n=1 Tax=Leuconostoc lactis TaxID=1246 RepID=A0AAP9JA51_LEULA|nr:helix-turn-helix transcriptional regulator [Leuconostoc lactis]QEA43283.1 helix-turn-helix transcriptional regulator [Leuconostoc lactis]
MKRLRELRLENAETQLDLSVELDFDAQEISRYERGVVSPSLKRLIMIADYFDVSIDYLVGRSDER